MLFKSDKNKKEKPLRKALKIYSPDEVIKAGGVDKFAQEIGHKSASQEIAGSIKFIDGEWAQIQKMLEED